MEVVFSCIAGTFPDDNISHDSLLWSAVGLHMSCFSSHQSVRYSHFSLLVIIIFQLLYAMQSSVTLKVTFMDRVVYPGQIIFDLSVVSYNLGCKKHLIYHSTLRKNRMSNKWKLIEWGFQSRDEL